MRKLLPVFAMLCSVLFVQSAFTMDLSFDMAVNMIMKESHDLKKARANVRKAEASLDAANANRWFKLDGSVTYMNLMDVERPFSPMGVDLPPALGGIISSALGQQIGRIEFPDNILMAGVSLSQPIYTFGKIGNAVGAVRNAIKISEFSLDLTRREVRYAAADIYWTAKMTDGLVGIYQKSLNDAIAAKKKLISAGRASRTNLVKIESDIATKEINLSDARFNRDTAYRMLKIFAGIQADEELVLTDDIPSKFEAIAADRLNNNPEWDIYERQIKMHEANALSKRAGNYPTLAATASYNYVAMHDDINVFGGRKTQSAYWGLALQVPIFDGGLNRANAMTEAMEAEAVRQNLDKSKKMKTEEYNTVVKKYEHLRSNLTAWENARGLAQKTYNISRDRFEAGQTSAVELAEVSAALSGVDMALLNAKYNILMSWESIRKLND
ncbi:MAG: TolC family protein [Rickettsiales bacterium]|jgi:outer membrane protein TolC|nr:TolC family protein [Rickettsiales bacterium]